MPRRGRSLRTIRTVKPKFKWSPMYLSESKAMPLTAQSDHTEITYTLAKNATTDQHIVPPVLKVRHVKVKLHLPAVDINEINCHTGYRAYVLFVPQAHEVTHETPTQHPEWVMATTSFGLQHTAISSISLTSPVSRNLNTGDSIVLLLARFNSSASTQASAVMTTINYTYVARTN